MPGERNVLREDAASFKGWSACADAMRAYDEDLVKGWKEEIDTLLLLAGLFSAVLTSFTVQSYQMLQPDPQDAMVFYMQTILTRLDAPSLATPLPTIPPFQPGAAPVRVNLVWFAGLVLSLIAGLVGILGKQWLREYTSHQLTAPRDAVHLRQFRYVGLVRWRVGDIIAMLPLLLQASLVLFIIGLLDLLWTVVGNTFVAAFSSAIVALSFIMIITSVILPLLFPECPFKSPLALQIRAAMLILKETVTRGPFSGSHSHYTGSLSHGWHDVDTTHLQAQDEAGLALLEHSALAWGHRTVLADTFQEALTPCVNDLPPHLRVDLVHTLLAHVARAPPDKLRAQLRVGPQGALTALHPGLLRAGHGAIARLLALVLDVLPDASYADAALTRADLLVAVHPLLNAFVWTGKQQYSTRDVATRRVYDVVIDVLGYEGQTAATLQAAFGLLMTFDQLFWKHVTYEDIVRMLPAALRESPPTALGPGCVSSYDKLIIAAPTVLHYAFALSPEHLAHYDLRRQLHELQHLIAMNIHLRHALGEPYISAPPVRVSVAWELCRLAQRDTSLVHLGLVRVLVQGKHAGLLPTSENGPLAVTLDMLRRAGIDRSIFPVHSLPLLEPEPLPPRAATRTLFSPSKMHTRTRSGSKSEPHVAAALLRSALRTASTSSGIGVDSPADFGSAQLPTYDADEKTSVWDTIPGHQHMEKLPLDPDV